MIGTIENLFNDPTIIKAVIQRIWALNLDEIYWQRYLTFEETRSRFFPTYYGTITGVTAGSIIDRNARKPLRKRRNIRHGVLSVAFLGDRYQLDNDRLDKLQELIKKYDAAGSNQGAVVEEIVNFMVDDLRQVLLAPHKRMDMMVGALRSTGTAKVNLSNNPNGIELIDIDLPVTKLKPVGEDVSNFVTYLERQIEELNIKIGRPIVMEMTRKTFVNNILGSSEFQNTYKMILSGAQVAMSGGLITAPMVNQVFTGIGLPPIRIINEYVAQPDGTNASTFADNRITLLTTENLGRIAWHEPYEAVDPIPGKTYTRFEGGGFVSNVRTEEGRFMEYGCEWIPNFINPDKIAIIDLDDTSEKTEVKRGRPPKVETPKVETEEPKPEK
jgi:hypothetical protein